MGMIHDMNTGSESLRAGVNGSSDPLPQGPWNPGIQSQVPKELRHLSTIYRPENVFTGITVLGFALPNFALALILIYIFSIKLAWLPITGIGSSEIAMNDWWAYFSPFIVPAIALSIHPLAVLTRLLRSSLIDVLSQDYLRTARAKGLMPSTIIIVHALKNAMIPFVTMAAIQSGHLIGAQVAIEYIFAIPGLGSAMLNAVVNRDFPVVQGVTLVIAMFFIAANIAADVMYSLLDPRIRY